jgi:predicted metal-dependent peptidase
MTTTEETRIKRGHITLMKHPDTALYSGVMLMGSTEVAEGKFTAYTDGLNKRYARAFVKEIKEEAKLRGLILHENLHIALKHPVLGKSMFKENPKMANMAADFVVNDIIKNIKGKTANGESLVDLPDGGLYHEMFHNWSMREVYEYLKENCKGDGGGSGKGGKDSNPSGDGNEDSGSSDGSVKVQVGGETFESETLDEHAFDENLTPEQAKEMSDKIDRALREGGMLAGRLGAKIPRVIGELLQPKVDWREVLRDFVTSATKGKDELTWRKLNKRHLANDMYLPNIENETIGEVIVAIDTSGSIGGKELSEFASELASICETVAPERVRVLWWDTQVHGEQVFQDNYQSIASLLKPKGGGGTRVSCVSEWLKKNPKVDAECVIVFTDGYLEGDIKWEITKPTLWLVTQNSGFRAPTGKQIKMERT